ncbi:MAG: hypothetical protein JSV12_00740 [Candidatus Bathyarchaeota archaeon]|nr:MAG: hypothetical protein JSV12_00740 [Candidatus Bathyarchaeota archaeon]
MSLKRLRKIAELNLCENCYEKYKAILEPSIKQWLFQPLPDWRAVESYITQMVMKLEGVFKTDVIFISLDEDSNEKYANEVDVEAFQKIKYGWSLRDKIKYLKKMGILHDFSYNLLDRVREIRNRIHDEFYEFSENDLILFHWARTITSQIHWATMFPLNKETSENVRSNAEKLAEQLLQKL